MPMRYEPRRHIDLMYATRAFRSGQTVTVTVYDSNGNEALASSSMTELGSTGVYKKRFTPMKSDTYFAIADCTEYPKKDFTTLVVGGKPGDLALGGFIPKLPPPVWREKEKKLMMMVISKLAQGVKTVELNQLKIETKISKLSQIKQELDIDVRKNTEILENNFSKGLSELNRKLELNTTRGFDNLLKEVSLLQSGVSRDLREKSKSFFDKLSKLSKEEVVKKIENFSLLADELNISLSQLSMDKSKIDLRNTLSRVAPQIDELLISLKNLNTGS